MIKTDGVIFDVDGTLWDSTDIVKDAWNNAFIDNGYDDPKITADRLKGLFGLPMADIIRDIFPSGSEEEIAELTPIIYKYEDSYLQEKGGLLYPSIIETIRTLAGSVPVFIVSNCQEGYIELFMNKTGCADCIRAHLCPGDTGMLKADNIRKIITDHKLEYPVYVGDTVMDRDACMLADCPFIYARYGFGKVDVYDDSVDSPAELLNILKY
ncbi:MAG: HAD hydrolase-like protein [Lachnospiraceae bacterium]|nr:HAD hydrolase-like protein [Lachnospiraceae bacterium]